MGYKTLLRKVARWMVLQPRHVIHLDIKQVNYGQLLQGKTILITGGGKGLGFAMTKKFLSEGASVIIVGRNEAILKSATKQLGTRANYLCFDVRDVNNIEKFMAAIEEKFGGIDVVVCNAGISLHEGNFKNVTIEGYDDQFNTNLRAPYFMAKSYLEQCIKYERKGNILFMSSETSKKCVDIPYGLTKAAINSLVGALSRRVYQHGIRVNAIAPGVTLTDMTEGCVQDNDWSCLNAAGRIFMPEEVAEVACFLVSDVSLCISGEVICCDAGNHILLNGNNEENE